MTKEEQNIIWVCLSKEMKDRIKSEYRKISVLHKKEQYELGILHTFENTFGYHNLISETDHEQDEMLMVRRKEVQIIYKDKMHEKGHHAVSQSKKDMATGWISAMKFFFSKAKCLPDKFDKEVNFPTKNNTTDSSNFETIGKDEHEHRLQTLIKVDDKPKFEIGDKVKFKYPNDDGSIDDSVYTINDIEEDEETPGNYVAQIIKGDEECIGLCPYYSFDSLEPYTEENGNNMEITNQENNNIEEKELNLYEILNDYVGEEFYLLGFGIVKFTKFQHIQNKICQIDLKSINQRNRVVETSVRLNGTWLNGDNTVVLYPSRALYEKYPLDAKKAWAEWSESMKPWTPEDNEHYWFVNNLLNPVSSIYDEEEFEDRARVKAGNFFRTEEEAQQAAEGVKNYLKTFQNNKRKNK